MDRLDKALTWSQEFAKDLRPRQVHSNAKWIQSDIDAVDEHFRHKRRKDRVRGQSRRASYANVPNGLTVEEWQDILREHDYRCAYCRKRSTALTMDHVLPISKGGPHTRANIVPACKSCNSRKGAKILTPLELT